jgi:hypothetical protein
MRYPGIIVKYTIRFDEGSLRDQNISAAELGKTLKSINGVTDVIQQRERADTMDYGAALGVVLGTGAAVALANGIADWLRGHRRAKITIVNESGKVILENVTGSEANKILEVIGREHN